MIVDSRQMNKSKIKNNSSLTDKMKSFILQASNLTLYKTTTIQLLTKQHNELYLHYATSPVSSEVGLSGEHTRSQSCSRRSNIF